MFQSKFTSFLGVYVIIGFLFGFTFFAKNFEGSTTNSNEIGPALLAGALWPIKMTQLVLGTF